MLVTERQVPLAMAFSDRGYVLEMVSSDSKGLRNNWRQFGCPPRLSGSDMTANILDGIVLGLHFGSSLPGSLSSMGWAESSIWATGRWR